MVGRGRCVCGRGREGRGGLLQTPRHLIPSPLFAPRLPFPSPKGTTRLRPMREWTRALLPSKKMAAELRKWRALYGKCEENLKTDVPEKAEDRDQHFITTTYNETTDWLKTRVNYIFKSAEAPLSMNEQATLETFSHTFLESPRGAFGSHIRIFLFCARSSSNQGLWSGWSGHETPTSSHVSIGIYHNGKPHQVCAHPVPGTS